VNLLNCRMQNIYWSLFSQCIRYASLVIRVNFEAGWLWLWVDGACLNSDGILREKHTAWLHWCRSLSRCRSRVAVVSRNCRRSRSHPWAGMMLYWWHVLSPHFIVIVWRLRGNIIRTVLYIANVLPLQQAQLAKTVHTARLGLEFVFLCFLGCTICLYVCVCFVLPWTV